MQEYEKKADDKRKYLIIGFNVNAGIFLTETPVNN